MRPMPVAVLLTAVIAGPPLYSLVTSGDLDSDNALLKAGIVLVACLLGATYIEGLVKGYERDQVLARRRAQIGEQRRGSEVHQSLNGLIPDHEPP
jgi:hypothetical protein